MGFTTGLTGGVALTLGITYLTVLAHQRNREAQSRSLRAQAYSLNALLDPIPRPSPPTRAELATQNRADFADTLKARWNQEVQGAVRWVQRTDWAEVREGVEDKVARLWGVSLEEEAAAAVATAREVAGEARAEAEARAASVSAAARSALEKTRARTEDVGAKAAAETKTAIASVVQRGVEKGKEIVGLAKNAAAVVGEKQEEQSALSPVEKALRQRYEKLDGSAQSITDALEERYVPIDQRDNSVLRGL